MPRSPKSILVLLGSGVSRASGMDGVRELTNHILQTPVIYTGRTFLPESRGVHAAPGHSHIGTVTQRFLRLLKAYADRYYSVRTGQESHYEDIYYLSRQISDDRINNIENPAVDGFIREVFAQAEPLFQHLVQQHGREKFQMLADRGCELIECMVADRLRTPAKIEGFRLLGEIANDSSIARLDIVTLNHDLLVESFLRAEKHPVVDGFDSGWGDVRRWTPGLFDATCRIRLLKLHGSINWHVYRQNDGPELFAIPTNGDADHAKDDKGHNLPIPNGPLFLAGTINKILAYGNGIFAEQFYRFHQFLSEHDTIVVSGYGFGDKGVNGRLWDWLFASTEHRMAILHAKPDELLAHARGSFHNAHQKFLGTGRLVVHDKWMQDANWSTDVFPLLSKA